MTENQKKLEKLNEFEKQIDYLFDDYAKLTKINKINY